MMQLSFCVGAPPCGCPTTNINIGWWGTHKGMPLRQTLKQLHHLGCTQRKGPGHLGGLAPYGSELRGMKQSLLGYFSFREQVNAKAGAFGCMGFSNPLCPIGVPGKGPNFGTE